MRFTLFFDGMAEGRFSPRRGFHRLKEGHILDAFALLPLFEEPVLDDYSCLIELVNVEAVFAEFRL